ncbi:MAG: hypothetical protein QE164_05045 [Candidatus Nezhaarchaeota archaeon]|nr:hypothetical protein [Candidatus Nezhaarchaeota archaeon]
MEFKKEEIEVPERIRKYKEKILSTPLRTDIESNAMVYSSISGY